MNVRDAAVERLLDTGLQERFGTRRAPDVRDAVAARLAETMDVARPPSHRHRFAVAALVLLGVFVAGGVAWLRASEDSATAQEPGALDPVFPWYERDFAWERAFTEVRTLEELAQMPPTTTLSVGVTDSELLAEVFQRKGMAELMLLGKDSKGLDALDADAWRALGAMQDLEVLALGNLGQVTATNLRELRAAPKLRSLTLIRLDCRLDAETGAALVELPRLRTLMTSGLGVSPGGVSALTGLPHLEALVLDGTQFEPGTTAAIARLRGLRMLCLSGATREEALTAAQMQQIATLPRLEVMHWTNLVVEDAAMHQLPQTLQSVEMGLLDAVSPGGLKALAHLPHLRSLSFRGGLAAGLDEVRVELVRALPLEHFESRVEAPSPELWEALRQAPKLRGLVVRCQGAAGSMTAECAKLPGLERLTLLCEHASRPEQAIRPEHLAVLKGHPKLRQLDIRCGHEKPSPEQFGDLRSALGPKIELVVR